jgi:divalent metal cation (Fe/Co/Zn/Cd) transporter
MLKSSSSQISAEDRYIAIRNITWLAIAINIFLTLLKIIFGIVGHSQALIADGLHSLSDLLVGAIYSTQPPDSEHPFTTNKYQSHYCPLIQNRE